MAPPNKNRLVPIIRSVDPPVLSSNSIERSPSPPKKQKREAQEQNLLADVGMHFFDPAAEAQIRHSQRLIAKETLALMVHAENERRIPRIEGFSAPEAEQGTVEEQSQAEKMERASLDLAAETLIHLSQSQNGQPIPSTEGYDVEIRDADPSEWAGMMGNGYSRKLGRSQSLDDSDSDTISYDWSATISEYTSESSETFLPIPFVPQIILNFDREHKMMEGVLYVERTVENLRQNEVTYDSNNNVYIMNGKLRPRNDEWKTTWMRVCHTMRRKEDAPEEIRDILSSE